MPIRANDKEFEDLDDPHGDLEESTDDSEISDQEAELEQQKQQPELQKMAGNLNGSAHSEYSCVFDKRPRTFTFSGGL